MSQKDGTFSQKTKKLVRLRCKNRCEICGIATDNGQFHHRKPRRMGGTSDENLGSPANCLYLHYKCHNRVESQRAMSYLHGYLVAASDDPESVAVRMWDGWWRLGPDGGMSPAEVDDSAEVDPLALLQRG